MLTRIDLFFGRPLPGVGLGVLRIAFALVMAAEVAQLIYFQPLIYEAVPGLTSRSAGIETLSPLWLLALLSLAAGYRTRLCAAFNAVMTYATFSSFKIFEYHVDCVYSAGSLLLVLSPVGASLSLDALRRRIRAAGVARDTGPGTVAAGWYFAWALMGIGLIYFDSIFHKLGADLWRHGLGIWLPASLPQSTWLSPDILNAVLNQRWLMVPLSHLTLAFETTFVLLMWFRIARPAVFLVGVGLHVGIFFAFPIPWFAAAEIAVYVALVPLCWFSGLHRLLKPEQTRARVEVSAGTSAGRRIATFLRALDVFSALEIAEIADAPGSLRVRRRDGVEHFEGAAVAAAVRAMRGGVVLAAPLAVPVLRAALYRWLSARPAAPRAERAWTVPMRVEARAILAGLVLAFTLQLHHVASFSDVGRDFMRQLGLAEELKEMRGFSRDLMDHTRRIAGIAPHAVFIDWHFRGYNHIIALQFENADGTRQSLPIGQPTGQSSWHSTGRQWAFWAFRANAPNISKRKLEAGLRRYTAFWALRNGVSLDDATFHVIVKKVKVSFEWEPDLLKKNAAAGWQDAGVVRWKNGKFTARVPNIERL